MKGSRLKQSSKSSNKAFQVKNGSSIPWYAPARHLVEGGHSKINTFQALMRSADVIPVIVRQVIMMESGEF